MNDDLRKWTEKMRDMSKRSVSPEEIWNVFSERSAEIQSILFGPEPVVDSGDGSTFEVLSDEQQAAEYIDLLLKKRGWTGSGFNRIHIEFSRSELPFIREICSCEGSVVHEEPLVNDELLHSDLRDECRELQLIWQTMCIEQDDTFFESVREILLSRLTDWENARIDIID